MTKRFWSQAAVVAAGGGWGVRLDGKVLRLPSGAELVMRTQALADAVAAEWQAAAGTFTAADVPLTGLAGNAQERVAPFRPVIIDTLAGYGGCDLLCYRVETPRALADLQRVRWQQWLDWAALRHAAPLVVTTGIAKVAQPAASLVNLRAALERRSDEALAALGVAIPALGSCVLGLALAERAIDAATAAELGGLETSYQAAQWGWDTDAADRRDRLQHDIRIAARFMALAEA